MEPFQELSYYTLSIGDREFIHQHAVDAQAAQLADRDTKPISIVFALSGLYLAVDRGWTGRAVQLFHMKMARHKRPWPGIMLPASRGSTTVADVLAVEPGEDRDARIRDWSRSVWEAYASSREVIRRLVSDIEPLP
jgi:hypothetical protein